MPSEYQPDYKKTCAYALKIYNDPNMSDTLRDIHRSLESRYVHEQRTIDPSFYNDLSNESVAKFTAIGFDCLLYLDEKVCPRPCELVIRENVYSAIGNRDHTQAVIALMLYCLQNRQPFNLAYFIIKRMYFFRDRRDKVLPYGMILTRLFKNLKENMSQCSFDERYKNVPRKMSSLKVKQPKRPPPKRTRNESLNVPNYPPHHLRIMKNCIVLSFHLDSPNFNRKTARMSVKYPNYVNLTSSSEEQPNERTLSPRPRKKSLSPPQAPSKSISSKSTHYTSSSSPKPEELPPPQISPNDPYAQTMNNWPPGPSNPSPPSRVSRPHLGFLNPPPEFKPLSSTQPLFVNINNNTPLLYNNASSLENIHHPPPNLRNQDFPNPLNILDFVHPNYMPHLHNMFCQCCSTTRHEI
nr:hypothetical protein [Tanacetum cinerariifolium]